MIIYKNKILLSSFLLSLFLIMVGASVVFVKLSDVQHLLIIHFDSFNGIDFLGSKLDVYGILLSGVVLNLINGFLVTIFYYRERFLSYILAFSNIVVSLLILIAIFVIVSIN